MTDTGQTNESMEITDTTVESNISNKSETDVSKKQEEKEDTCKENKEKDKEKIEEAINNKERNDNIPKENSENFNSKFIFNSDKNSLKNTSSETSLSSLSSSLNSLNIKNSTAVVEPILVSEENEIDKTSNTLNLTSPNTSKAKAVSSTTLETASSSVIVNSETNATSSILHIKNSASSYSLNDHSTKSHSSHEHKKKSKGKHKAKGEEEQEIDEIRNSAANLPNDIDDIDAADEFMGLASSSVINKNKNNDGKEDNSHKKKGKNKSSSKESKDSNSNKVNYGKGPSAVVEGPYTVFHSSSSSSSLDFLLESAAVASSSRHNNDEPPLNINFNRNLSHGHNGDNSTDNDRVDIEHLAESGSSSLLGLRYTQKNLEDIILKPVSLDQSIKCTLIRSKVKNIPSYELYIEHTDSTFSLLLYSRKVRIGNHNEYLITRKMFTSVPDESEIIGRLKSNFVGTAFVLYDNNKKHVRKDNVDELRSELGAVLYEPNILGFKGPRKMKVITTRLDDNGEFIPCRPRQAKETLIERSKDPFDREMLVLYNKSPQWNEETQSYVLNFNHRVRIASVKNFQIVNNDDLDYIIMQFGKKKKNIFTLDFRYPFSALLAFAIALTSLDTKIACE